MSKGNIKPAGKVIKLIIADDHQLIRSGIKYMLAETSDIAVVGEAANGTEAVSLARSIQWDVAILDVNMPIRTGIDALKIIHDEWPDKAILILSMYPEEQYAVRAIELGASGYLTKGSISNELIVAIRYVHKGRKYITPMVAERLAGAVGNKQKGKVESLSNRELQILMLIASGRTLVQAAEALNLSVSTVSEYRRRILQKLGLENTNELVRFGVERGLVD